MFKAAYLVNGEWISTFETNEPSKALLKMKKIAKLITGCTMCGIFNPVNNEMLCYTRL